MKARAEIPAPLIVGPTAGGKTSLAVAVARALERRGHGPAEVVSADAFCVYRGMDIGTAKPAADERARAPHHAIDIREPTEPFTVHEWLAEAERAMADIRARGGVPIVAGGTHLYAKALLDGLFEGPEPDPAVRAELDARPLGDLRTELERVDAAAAARIHPNDRRRAVRALEVYLQTGTPISVLQSQWDAGAPPRGDLVLVVIEWETARLNTRINARLKAMLDAGLVDEARSLWASNRLGPQAAEALGYKQLVEHFEGRVTLDKAAEQIKIQTRRFAKNQRTWLRRLAAGFGERAIRIDGATIGDNPAGDDLQTGAVVDRLLETR